MSVLLSCLFYLSNLRMLFALRLCERALRPHGGRGEQLPEKEGAPLEADLQRLGVPRLMRDRLQKQQKKNAMRYGKALLFWRCGNSGGAAFRERRKKWSFDEIACLERRLDDSERIVRIASRVSRLFLRLLQPRHLWNYILDVWQKWGCDIQGVTESIFFLLQPRRTRCSVCAESSTRCATAPWPRHCIASLSTRSASSLGSVTASSAACVGIFWIKCLTSGKSGGATFRERR